MDNFPMKNSVCTNSTFSHFQGRMYKNATFKLPSACDLIQRGSSCLIRLLSAYASCSNHLWISVSKLRKRNERDKEQSVTRNCVQLFAETFQSELEGVDSVEEEYDQHF